MEQTDGEILLEMNHVKKSFDGNGVLEDISLTVKKGEVVSIIGPSGSGKSTLLRCATLLEKMDGGELIYLGQTAASEKTDKNGRVQCEYASKAELHKIRKCFGLVFQNFNLFPHYTVMKNIIDAPIHVDKTPPYRKVRTDAPGIFKGSPPSQIEHIDLDWGVMDISCRPERTGTGTIRYHHGADESY